MMKPNLTTTVFLALGVLVLSACGAEGVGITDPSNVQGALEADSEGSEAVGFDCLEQCIDKGESEEDCAGWCSKDESTEDCLEQCIDKGESEEDCVDWCSKDDTAAECFEECVDKGESEEDCTQWCDDSDKSEWDDKDECDYEDKDDYEDK
ncbi:MAG: hypothetical protein HOK97_04325 [Deltaproteobacteria bacterium]|jgi:hypothetical protein|nr:hypothetical protein [Deltaproteobacteria bacterium]